ncbi:MAG: hypothetical protein KC766_09940 [Myxococcales bacterium]|nr:hypothetical protein [Myxococcales bacterium]
MSDQEKPRAVGFRRWARWLLVPLGLWLGSLFWPAFPRDQTLTLDLGPNSARVEALDLTWTFDGEHEPRGGVRRSFPQGAPRRVRQRIYGPSGDWEIHVQRTRTLRGDSTPQKTSSQHRVNLAGEESILFIKDPAGEPTPD